jgi:hypothetical protein
MHRIMFGAGQGAPLHVFEGAMDRLVHIFVFATAIHVVGRIYVGCESQLQVHCKEIALAVVTVRGFENYATAHQLGTVHGKVLRATPHFLGESLGLVEPVKRNLDGNGHVSGGSKGQAKARRHEGYAPTRPGRSKRTGRVQSSQPRLDANDCRRIAVAAR